MVIVTRLVETGGHRRGEPSVTIASTGRWSYQPGHKGELYVQWEWRIAQKRDHYLQFSGRISRQVMQRNINKDVESNAASKN